MPLTRLALPLITLVIVAVFTASPTTSLADKDIKVEDIISRHLDSIGSAESRSNARPRMMIGRAQMTVRSHGNSDAAGNAVLASKENKSMMAMKFGVPSYPYEKVGYDGDKVTAYALRPGVYSALGDFIKTYPSILKEGLLGGTLSAAWPLLDHSTKKAKLEYGGSKKIGSRQVLEVKYQPRGGSDLTISLFFDAESYQHVRTVYKKTVGAQVGGNIDQSAGQSESRYELIEDFSDFKLEKGLNLPHTYEIHYRFIAAESRYYDWTVNLLSFVFDQPIDAKDFNVAN
jgi:hypothetical protein